MLTKSLLAVVLAACGIQLDTAVTESAPEQPDEWAPPDDTEPIEGQHFCCESVSGPNGNGCVMIGKEHTSLCDKILYCGGSWNKDGDKVTCLD